MKNDVDASISFDGVFITDVSVVQQKLQNIKAFIFDWDGVFNDGRKDLDGNSSFSEIDSMGINMMRFSYYLLHGRLPISIIISGEHNKLAMLFATRENFHSLFHKMLNKKIALEYLCNQHNITSEEVLFVFDDVLDFTVAKAAGLRCMIGRVAGKQLMKFAIDNNLVDYITKHDGNNYGLREISEMIMTLSGNFNTTIENRMHFSEAYTSYLQLRKNISTSFFVAKENQVAEYINL